MSSIITLLLTLIGQLLPAVGASTAGIQTILNALIAVVPALFQEAMDLVPIVQNIIAALKNNPATTQAQMVTLNDLDAQCDAAFEDAVAKSQASDPGVAGTPAATVQPMSLFGAPPPLDAQGLRLDGPTLAEWTALGYPKEAYPPAGYAAKEAPPPVQAVPS